MTALDEITKECPGGRETGSFNFEGLGTAFHLVIYSERTVLDLTTPPGVASGTLTGYFFYLRKKGYEVHKLDDWMEISPVNHQYYQLTIQQKQELERQIKEGLASISTAISEFELLLHDLRKYKEFMNTFESIEKAKKEKNDDKLKEGEQTLKAIFIDQVDVHTGEGIALRSIAQRWPTIIADFMKLKDEDTEHQKIASKPELQVSEAEGVVLATKNKLYIEWKKMFRESVIRRYGELKMMIEARKKSIINYRDSLKPYITRYRSIKEIGETPEGRKALEEVSFYRPAAQAVSIDSTITWAWKTVTPPEFAKGSRGGLIETKNIFRMPISRTMKRMVREYIKKLKEEKREKDLEEFMKKFGQMQTSPTGIEPLDDFVMKYYGLIEKYYNIKLSIEDILEVRNDFIKKCINSHWTIPYFSVMEVGAFRTTIKPPQGQDIEDLWLEPFWPCIDTQNVILLRLLELKAKEKELERYISDMIGETADGRRIEQIIMEEYPILLGGPEIKKEEEEKPKLELFKRPKIEIEKKKEGFEEKLAEKIHFGLKMIKPGPYEPHLEDIMTGIYIPEVASSYASSVDFFKSALGVPGVRIPV